MTLPVRFSWTLVVAVTAHLAALAWMNRAPAERTTPATDGHAMELDVEPLEALEAAPSESAPAALDPPPTERLPSTQAKRDERRTSVSPGEARITQEPGEPQPPVPPSGQDGTWTFSPSTTTDTPGGGPLAGHALNDAVRSGVQATVAESQRAESARRHLLPAFNAHDVELGLAPGSALATLTQELVRRSRVPTEGHALLRLDSDALGIVASVHILEASAGHAEWNELAGQIATESRTKPPQGPGRRPRGLRHHRGQLGHPQGRRRHPVEDRARQDRRRSHGSPRHRGGPRRTRAARPRRQGARGRRAGVLTPALHSP